MISRFKLIAAALGLVIAVGAIGEASAATVKTVVTHRPGFTKTVRIVTTRPHRVWIGPRVVHAVRRAPVRIGVLAPRFVAVRKVVRIGHGPHFVRHAWHHPTVRSYIR